ncbi:MAG TPA: hypothetical protein VHO26_02590 [Propionibacteriaceae bacterium]|nr:hypothetical protein [Propionibacteriaceae bacterium]
MTSRRYRWAGVALAVTAVLGSAACAPSTTPTPAPAVSSGSASAKVQPLTAPGAARAAIDQLVAAAGTHQAVKVDISATEASLSIVRNGQPFTWAWTNGVVGRAQSDIANVNQASFDPGTFNLDNVGELFKVAAQVSGSQQNQQLQIVEYNQGQVLMTVTTNPESATVFFRPDGTLVHTLDFTTAEGISEALRDCLGTSTQVGVIGYRPESGLYVELPGSQQGVITVVTRPKSLPRWAASEKGTLPQLFDASLVNPAVVASIIQLASAGAPVSPDAVASATDSSPTGRPTSTQSTASTAPTQAGGSDESSSASSVQWVIDRRDKLAQPVLRVTAHGTTRAFTLDGVEVTHLVGS